MGMSVSCPSSQELRQLLEERLSGDRYTKCLQHLDTCTGCQESLEELATGQPHWSTIVAHVDRDRPAANSAYWPALWRVGSIVGEPLELESPADSGPVAIDFLETSTDPGYLGSLAHFNIVRILGRGGMGVVMEAFDRCLERRVAIKVLDPRLAENEVARQRFCREARAAAAITHENVVALYQVEKAEESGIAFLVMQLVEGETLEQRLIRQRRLPVADVVRIGMQVAAGLAAAHARGLIHRDVKPGNILLERPFDRVKLTDFGLVRATEDVRLTQTGFVTGTPLYMAPEQALGDEIDERTDLFSLGAVLYELCTGRTPFAGRTPLAVLKSITDTSPEPIQDLNPEVPDWLARLVERLLAKRPEDRFSSAAEVAEVLASHYAELHPLSPLQLPGISRSSAAVPMNLSGPTRLATFSRGRIAFFCTGLLAIAAVAWFAFDFNEADATTRPVAVLSGNAGPIWSIAFSPDGKTLLTGIDDGTVRLWDVPGRRVRSTVHAHQGPAWAVAVSAEGDLFATGTDDGSVKIWDPETGEERRTLQTDHPVRALAFAPQGTRLAVGCRTGHVEIWDAEAGERQLSTAGHSSVVVSIAYSPDGTMLGTASGDKSAKLWDARTGAELVSLTGHNGGVYGITFTADSRQVVTGGWDRTVRLWDVADGNLLATLGGHDADVWAVAASPSQPIAISVGEDRTVRVWDLAERSSLATLIGHEGTLYTAAFARDGHHIASAGRDGTVRLWSVDQIMRRPEVAD